MFLALSHGDVSDTARVAQFVKGWNPPQRVWSDTPRLEGSVFGLALSSDGTYTAPGHKPWVKQALQMFAFTANPFPT